MSLHIWCQKILDYTIMQPTPHISVETKYEKEESAI
jgi:hypothetical protein